MRLPWRGSHGRRGEAGGSPCGQGGHRGEGGDVLAFPKDDGEARVGGGGQGPGLGCGGGGGGVTTRRRRGWRTTNTGALCRAAGPVRRQGRGPAHSSAAAGGSGRNVVHLRTEGGWKGRVRAIAHESPGQTRRCPVPHPPHEGCGFEFARIRTNSNSVRIRSNSELSFTNSHYDSIKIEFARICTISNSGRIRSNSN